jgi:hypothetical protein
VFQSRGIILLVAAQSCETAGSFGVFLVGGVADAGSRCGRRLHELLVGIVAVLVEQSVEGFL